MTSIHFSKKYIYTPIIVFLIFITSIFQSVDAKDTSLMIMITDKNCLYCIVWEKQIGKIYPKTEIAKKFSLLTIIYYFIYLSSNNFSRENFNCYMSIFNLNYNLLSLKNCKVSYEFIYELYI